MLPALPGIVLCLLRRHRQPPLARRDAQQLTARRAVVAGQAEERSHHADADPQPQAAVDQGLTVLVTIDARQDPAQASESISLALSRRRVRSSSSLKPRASARRMLPSRRNPMTWLSSA